MESVIIRTEPAYEAVVGRGLLAEAGERTAKAVHGRRVLVTADLNVAPLYLEEVCASFEKAGFRTNSFVFPAGEEAKTLQTVESMLEAAAEAELTRSDLFAALGGGVTGDMTGLGAALYQRGIDFVQMPTTLLAMVDASVGGKTAVNLSHGKNLCGAFHQPRLVICDTGTLNTLEKPVRAEGMAEMIKHGMLSGGPLLDRIEAGADPEELIAENIRFKSGIVEQDEKEHGARQLLNFGHTFGHGVEKLTGYSIYHGEGVSIGMMIAAFAAERHGICPEGVFSELRELLLRESLPVTTAYSAGEIAEAAMNDKKRRGDNMTLVVPEKRGTCRLITVPCGELAGWTECCDGTVTGV